MVTRSNLLLFYSIVITVAVIIYIGRHVNINDYKNFAGSSAYSTQEQNQDSVQAILSQEEIDPNTSEQTFEIDEITQMNTFVNNTNSDDGIVTEDEKVIDEYDITDDDIVTFNEKDIGDRLRSILNCYDRNYIPEILQRGNFWVFKNYIRAEHGQIKCHSSITYTTHADFTFLDNVIPLLERWNAPLSLAIHTPGTDFQPTLEAIKYLRECLPQSYLVRMFTTFHIYFNAKHFPGYIPKYYDALTPSYNCTLPPPYANVNTTNLYKTQKKLLYPINVGRNIARDAALTHFVLASDIELYPSTGLVKQFLEMIVRNGTYLHRKAPRVFTLPIFELKSNIPVPNNKTELQNYLQKKKAIPFHKDLCGPCHNLPGGKEWRRAKETDKLNIFLITKRLGSYKFWEPIFIGTHADPYYDERLNWEGGRDKMSQAYNLCVLDYEFYILDNAFLVHKPGIKARSVLSHRLRLQQSFNGLKIKDIYAKLRKIYGRRTGCSRY